MNKITKEITELIAYFDEKESVLHHEKLNILLPIGFFRYNEAIQNYPHNWKPVKVHIQYRDKDLFFNIKIIDKSISQGIKIIQTKFLAEKRIAHYKFNKVLNLSLADSKELIKFLMNYFCSFSFNLRTRLSR